MPNEEEKKEDQVLDIEELLEMDTQRQQVYNNSIEYRQLKIENFHYSDGSLRENIHTHHTSNYRTNSIYGIAR